MVFENNYHRLLNENVIECKEAKGQLPLNMYIGWIFKVIASRDEFLRLMYRCAIFLLHSESEPARICCIRDEGTLKTLISKCRLYWSFLFRVV